MRLPRLGRGLYVAEGLLVAACLLSSFGLYYGRTRQESALGQARLLTDYSRTVHVASLNCRRYLDSVLSGGLEQLGRPDAAKKNSALLSEVMGPLQKSRVYASTLAGGEETARLDQVRRFLGASGTLVERIAQLKREGRAAEARDVYRNRLLPLLYRYAEATLREGLDENESQGRLFQAGLQSSARLSLLCVLAVAASSLLLVALWTRRFLAYVDRNLEKVRRALAAVASGNLDISLTPEHDDELGRLSQALNEMTRRLEETQRRALELERTVAQGRLATGAAQALNNPLAAVIGNAELLLRRDILGTQEQEEVRVIRDQARRCEAILRNLRQFASAGQGEKRPVRLGPLLRSLLELLEPTLGQAGVSLDLRLDETLPAVSADPHQLRQVFYNLLLNALRALRGRAEPRLSVSTRSEGGEIVVEIEDNGEGIAPEDLPRLFEPFFTTRAPSEGMGLGLSSAWGIVREHGGKLAAQSRPGEGARFEVRLPRPAVPESEPARRGGPARVLVVDDEAEILSLVGRVLGQEGHSVDCLQDPRQALEAADRNVYDLIVSDYRMDAMDGVALFEAIRRRQPRTAARFVFSTGEIVSKELQGFADRHGIPVLLKPFDLEELIQVVRSRLND